MAIDNDTRGWILTCISAVGCVLGSLVICVDLIVRLLPSKKDFKIQDSNGFLSCSLGLSAGVMLFSSLYSMLPSAKSSLDKGASSHTAAAWILIGTFLGGVFGIQIFTRICHHFMPHHAVDCDHTHDNANGERKNSHSHGPQDVEAHPRGGASKSRPPKISIPKPSEDTPLLSRAATSDGTRTPTSPARLDSFPTRPALQERVTSKVTRIVTGAKNSCDADGPCYGYSDPCAEDCFKNVLAKGGSRWPSWATRWSKLRQERAGALSPRSPSALSPSSSTFQATRLGDQSLSSGPQGNTNDYDENANSGPDHHHHVPENAFLSISLQTSIAISLHKLPEGFITYATNHANPTLGFAVFLAIAIHNVTEGFALALPIFLASGSRMKAIFWTVLLGGLSQPIGAGIAAAWLKIAEKRRGGQPGEEIDPVAYGALFAITAGIMASVALSLLGESFELSHSKGVITVFAFVGMGILGVSNALTA